MLATLACFGVRAIYRALASPEKRIRWRMEEMVEGFNSRKAQPVLDGIAKEFVDRSSDVTRDDLHSTLVWMFLNEHDDKGEFLWSAVFDPKEMTIVVAQDKHSAAVECRVQFLRRRGTANELNWDARVTGTFSLDQNGWQWSVVNSANHEARLRR